MQNLLQEFLFVIIAIGIYFGLKALGVPCYFIALVTYMWGNVISYTQVTFGWRK